MNNLTLDRNQSNLRKWWESMPLCLARTTLAQSLQAELTKVEHAFLDPRDHDSPYKQRLALGLMPPCHTQGAAMYYVKNLIKEKENPGQSFTEKYTTERLFGLMIHTWTTEALLSYAEVFPTPLLFDINNYHDNLWSLSSEFKRPVCKTVDPLADRIADLNREDIDRLDLHGIFPGAKLQLSCRDGIVRAFINVFAEALSAIPEEIERQISNRSSMLKIFNEIEPLVRNAPLHIYYESTLKHSEKVMCILKEFWSEARDAVVFGLNPPFPFDEAARARNIIHATVAMEWETDESPNALQIQGVVHGRESFKYIRDFFGLQECHRHFWPRGVMRARHDITIDEERKSVKTPEFRLRSNWCHYLVPKKT